MEQLSGTRCSCIAISRVSLVSFVTITLCVASQVFNVVVYFIIDSVCKLWDTPSYYLWSILHICLFSSHDRTHFVSSTTDLRHQEELHQQKEVSCSYNYSELTSELQAAAAKMRRKRSPSLPPIYSRTAPTCQVLLSCMPRYLTCSCVVI